MAAHSGAARSVAQTFCLVFGVVLVAAGVLGFIFGGTSFNVPDRTGQEFIVFEVNGWHNLLHIASGALLLVAAPKEALAATVAAVLGIAYVVVTLWGFIDGNDILWIFPVNTADNILHLAIAIVALAAAALSGGLMAKRRKEGPARA